jgi:hypothetical protein
MPYWHRDEDIADAQQNERIMGISGKARTQESRQEEFAGTDPGNAAPRRGRWSTAFLMAGSAILGATAVAFWNRRTIANMRAQFLAESRQPRSKPQPDEEIF